MPWCEPSSRFWVSAGVTGHAAAGMVVADAGSRYARRPWGGGLAAGLAPTLYRDLRFPEGVEISRSGSWPRTFNLGRGRPPVRERS